MFFSISVEFGRRKPVEDDGGMVHESVGHVERAPIGFSVDDPWEEEEDG